MKRLIYSISTAALVLAGITTSCNTPKEEGTSQQNVDAAKENLDQAEEAYLMELEQYKLAEEAKIAENERKLAEFKASIAANKKSDPTMTTRMEDLERRNAEMKIRLAEFKADSKSKWESFKVEFDHDMNEMGDAFADLFTNNKK
jgi:hypothetical protein